jgi:hypothetical protein
MSNPPNRHLETRVYLSDEEDVNEPSSPIYGMDANETVHYESGVPTQASQLSQEPYRVPGPGRGPLQVLVNYLSDAMNSEENPPPPLPPTQIVADSQADSDTTVPTQVNATVVPSSSGIGQVRFGAKNVKIYSNRASPYAIKYRNPKAFKTAKPVTSSDPTKISTLGDGDFSMASIESNQQEGSVNEMMIQVGGSFPHLYIVIKGIWSITNPRHKVSLFILRNKISELTKALLTNHYPISSSYKLLCSTKCILNDTACDSCYMQLGEILVKSVADQCRASNIVERLKHTLTGRVTYMRVHFLYLKDGVSNVMLVKQCEPTYPNDDGDCNLYFRLQ